MNERSPRRRARMIVDLAAIRRNWRFYASLGQAEAAAVVKADGYGLGAERVAQALAAEGARTFFVASVEEALALRAALGAGPVIYALEGPTEADVARFAPASISPVLNSLPQIALWRGAGAAALHIDTGMNRLGVPVTEAGRARALLERPALLMSHLACAGDAGAAMNATQRARFLEAASLFPGVPLSLGASSGALLGPDFGFDLLRPGIGLFGDDGRTDNLAALSPVATLLAPILQLREIEPGDSVGYGATFITERPRRVATIALGYADGYLRSASGRGFGALDGVRTPMLGRVSMDLITLDVTEVGASAVVGAEIEMLGADVPLREVAAAAGTISYEVLTNLARVARTYSGA